jgi:hypothetical protein
MKGVRKFWRYNGQSPSGTLCYFDIKPRYLIGLYVLHKDKLLAKVELHEQNFSVAYLIILIF